MHATFQVRKCGVKTKTTTPSQKQVNHHCKHRPLQPQQLTKARGHSNRHKATTKHRRVLTKEPHHWQTRFAHTGATALREEREHSETRKGALSGATALREERGHIEASKGAPV